MSLDESLEVTRIYSVAGLLGERAALVRTRPFRVPHHHISLAGLVGGGSGLARPGEVSMAHRGVLFLDELTLYRRDVLETLRGPVEEGVVRIARSGGIITYPCRFSLVAAMNPCACGYLGDSLKSCRCSAQQLEQYRARVSGPLLDRFDIHIAMARVGRRELMGERSGAGSDAIRARVERARSYQAARYLSLVTTNASATKAELDNEARLTPTAKVALGVSIDSLSLSGRGVDRVLRVARTIADLDAATEISDEHISEAVSYRDADADALVGA
jgi:magnesium chelatase family protein